MMKCCTVLVAFIVLMAVSCQERTPNRDFIPVLKQQVYALQEAVKAADRGRLDSLLTDDLREHNGADSLIRFVSGADGRFQFAQFAQCEILYNDDKARADCVLLDSAGQAGGAVTLTMVNTQGKWLLKRFETKPAGAGQ